MSTPSLATIKRLFARCGNRCAFQGCESPMVEDSGTVTGEICHIRAASKGGPRYDGSQTEEQRSSSDNLILLCGRHHAIVDAEPKTFTVQKLLRMKDVHERSGIVEITPQGAKAAERLLNQYLKVTVHRNVGQIAINSPGAIHAQTVNVRTIKPKLVVTPPVGSIGADRRMLSYGRYLIDRYQEFQKADKTKADRFKFMAIHGALKREFKGDWKLLPIVRFPELIEFLHRRIDNTIIGRIRKAEGASVYHSFDDHP